MRETAAEPPSSLRVLMIVGALALLAGFINDVNEWLFTLTFRWLSTRNWIQYHHVNALDAAIFLLEGLLLCLLTPRACGLTFGSAASWKRYAIPVLLFGVVPPLAVLLVYGPFTDRPFSGISPASWFWKSIAQQLLFCGFIFARLRALSGDAGGLKAAVSMPVVMTALLFSLWHWPNVRWLSPEYMAFQFLYTFLGECLLLQMRRLTGSILPCAASHVAVNYLAGAA